jgi:cardiolipin synthase
VFVWLLFGAHRQTAAAVLLAILGATDWVDGFAARRLHQVSTVGKVLDPVADRVLVGTAVSSVLVAGAAPVWLGATILVREVVVSAAVVTLAILGARRIDVLWVGKAGTLLLMVAFPLFLGGHGTSDWQQPFRVAAWLCAGPGLALAWLAAARYLPLARQAVADGRRARSAPPIEAGDTGKPAEPSVAPTPGVGSR